MPHNHHSDDHLHDHDHDLNHSHDHAHKVDQHEHHNHDDHNHAHGHSHAGHSHGHGHHHHHVPSKFTWAFAISVILNSIFMLIEAVYAISAHSMSLLADAGHNLSDILGLLMAWGASWLLTRPSTERYSYGYKKTSIVAALVNALLLVAATAIIAYESIRKLMEPVTVHEWTIIIVAFIGIFINGGTALLFMRGSKEDLNIKGAFLHLAGDAIISLGVVIGGIIVLLTHWFWVDPLVGLLIVITILIGTWGLLMDSVQLILDAVPSNIDSKGVEKFLAEWPGVTTVHDLHIWGLSTKEVALTAHLIMPEHSLSDAEYLEINKILKDKYKIDHVTLQVEKGNQSYQCEQLQSC